jgi:hypothetical protein
MFYSKVSFSFTHGVYCIDDMVEHSRLLHYISKGLCKLDKSAVPERFEEHFKPYIIESMEFEFVKLGASSNKLEIKEQENLKRRNNQLRIIDNLELAPVRNVFTEKIEKLMVKVRSLKMSVDFTYFLFFLDGYKILHEGSASAQDVLARILLTLICQFF